MTLHPSVHPEADAEFLDAVRYYQVREAGLGDELDAEVARAVGDVLWNPDAWPPVPGWDRLPIVRSRQVDVFPYRIIYFVRGDELVIVAFAHQSRRPGYWESRAEG